MFWVDNWSGVPGRVFLNFLDVPRRFRALTFRQLTGCVDATAPYPLTRHDAHLFNESTGIVPNSCPDAIAWRWSRDGDFSVAGAYKHKLTERGMSLLPHCVFCHAAVLETSVHIFCVCPALVQFWGDFFSLLGRSDLSVSRCSPVSEALCLLWSDSSTQSRSFVCSALLCAFYNLWKEHNSRMFNAKERPLPMLAADAIKDAKHFTAYA